jgi:hypothetical protein
MQVGLKVVCALAVAGLGAGIFHGWVCGLADVKTEQGKVTARPSTTAR